MSRNPGLSVTQPLAAVLATCLLLLGTSCRVSGAPECGGEQPTIVGTSGRDVLRGTPDRDVISALEGNDLLLGLEGDDVLCGGPGEDTLRAGPGSDSLIGGADRDSCHQGTGAGSRASCDDSIVLAAGDIACAPTDPSFLQGDGTERACRQVDTSDVLIDAVETGGASVVAVLALGDTQYGAGSSAEYRLSYDPSWGRFKGITYPVPGNNEYETPDAAGYFAYFGESAGPQGKGFYSFDVAGWHVVGLNSQCWEVGGCSGDDPQAEWLERDLAGAAARCTLAFFHHPRFSSSAPEPNGSVKAIWQVLYANGVDVVLNGHNHNYERFAPQTPSGSADPIGGVREFVVGTGGVSLHPAQAPRANSEVVNDDTFGVLELILFPAGYEWRFIAVPDSGFTDSGAASCH